MALIALEFDYIDDIYIIKETDIMNLDYAPEDNNAEEYKKLAQECGTMERSTSISISKWTDHP